MERLFNQQFCPDQLAAARAWLAANAIALSVATVAQVVIIGLVYVAAWAAAARVRRLFASLGPGRFEPQIARLGGALGPLRLDGAAGTNGSAKP